MLRPRLSSSPPWAVVCDRTAAWLHGIDTFTYGELDILPPLEIFALRGRHRLTRDGLSGGERDLSENDVMTIGQIKVTTPLRTALDLGCRLSRRDALATLDAFMRTHGLTRTDLRRELARFRRRRGVVQLRELIEIADARAESPGESRTRLCIVDDGLPVPELQFSVVVGGRELFRLDLAFPRLRVCVEYDGVEFHTSNRDVMHDRERRDWLRAHGWTVIVVTKNSFGAEELREWLSQLRSAIGF